MARVDEEVATDDLARKPQARRWLEGHRRRIGLCEISGDIGGEISGDIGLGIARHAPFHRTEVEDVRREGRRRARREGAHLPVSKYVREYVHMHMHTGRTWRRGAHES